MASTKTKNIIKEDLLKTLDDKEKDLLEQLQLCEDRILDDMTEQAYIFGYETAAQLRDDAYKEIIHFFTLLKISGFWK